MPAISQNITFTVNSSTVTSLIFPLGGISPLGYTSTKVKGDGYYGNSDGYHTIQLKTTNFIGKITTQATLEVEPTETSWFDVNLENNQLYTDVTGLVLNSNIPFLSYTVPTSQIKIYNFVGNFIWIRFKITDFLQGSIDHIKYNH